MDGRARVHDSNENLDLRLDPSHLLLHCSLLHTTVRTPAVSPKNKWTSGVLLRLFLEYTLLMVSRGIPLYGAKDEAQWQKIVLGHSKGLK